MSVIATAVKHLMAAGVTGEALLAAIAEMEDQVRAEPKPRSAGAIRQERYRRNKSSQVTECYDSDEVSPPYSPPNDIYSNPPHDPPQHTTGARDDFPCPDWCEPTVWRDLKRNRKTKKLTNTPTAHKRFVDAVEAMADDEWPPGRLVEAIAARGWGGAYDPRDDRKPNNDNRRQGNSNQRTADLAAEKLRGLQ